MRDGLTIEDRQRMGVRDYTGRTLGIPDFATDMKAVQHVLLQRGWSFLHRGRVPPGTDLHQLDQVCTVTIRYKADRGVAGYDKLQAAVERSGTYLSLEAQILWRAWRLFQRTPDIAAELGMSAGAVAIHLDKLRRTGARLGLATGLPAPQPLWRRMEPTEAKRRRSAAAIRGWVRRKAAQVPPST